MAEHLPGLEDPGASAQPVTSLVASRAPDSPATGRSPARVVVLSANWRDPTSERAFVVRSLAGALSRHVAVDVVAPGPVGSVTSDGLFDVRGAGEQANRDGWPSTGDVRLPDLVGPADGPTVAAVVDAADAGARRLLRHLAPELPLVVVAASRGGGRAGVVRVTPSGLGLHVPVNPLAGERPHNGFGFTDYLLVLSDRAAAAPVTRTVDGAGPALATTAAAAATTAATTAEREPPPLAAWLIARFPRERVVVVEDATATAWQHRSHLGAVHVDTRMDLWRLMAHARATVDLGPGPLVARECIESLRFSTPVVAPHGTGTRVGSAGGLWYRDLAGLLGCVEALADRSKRAVLARRGRERADARHGDAAAFTDKVGQVLADLA